MRDRNFAQQPIRHRYRCIGVMEPAATEEIRHPDRNEVKWRDLVFRLRPPQRWPSSLPPVQIPTTSLPDHPCKFAILEIENEWADSLTR
jgi:hypothetical protein